MRFSSGFYLQLSNGLLACATAYTLGGLGGELLHRQILTLPLPSIAPLVYRPASSAADSGRKLDEFSVIVERNVFNAQKTEVAQPPPPEPEPQAEVAIPETSEELEPTRLQIALTGTMVYGTDIAFAFISQQGSLNEYTIYQLGDCFHPQTVRRDKDCREDSVKVLEIGDRRVVILHRGKKQALWMQVAKGFVVEPPKSALHLSKSTALIVPPTEKAQTVKKKKDVKPQKTSSSRDPGVAKEGQTSFHFERIWVDEQLEKFDQLLMDARVVPTKKGDRSLFMFQFIKDKSIYRKLGLQTNDIILEINGFAVDSLAKALKLLEMLQSEREIALKIERNGLPIDYSYYID